MSWWFRELYFHLTARVPSLTLRPSSTSRFAMPLNSLSVLSICSRSNAQAKAVTEDV